MPIRIKALLTLLAIAPVLTEILSGKPRGALCSVRLTALPEWMVAIQSSARRSYTDRSIGKPADQDLADRPRTKPCSLGLISRRFPA